MALIDRPVGVDNGYVLGWNSRSRSDDGAADRTAALLRITGSIDDYLYTNEHLPDGSRRSVYSGANRERLMGGPTPPGADVATEWERLIVPEDWPLHLAHRERLRNGDPSEVTYRLLGYDGVMRWICARTRPSSVDGRLFVDGIVSDITARVEAEQALLATQEELRQQMQRNAHQASHDALTGLANRRKLLVDLDAMIDQTVTARLSSVISTGSSCTTTASATLPGTPCSCVSRVVWTSSSPIPAAARTGSAGTSSACCFRGDSTGQ